MQTVLPSNFYSDAIQHIKKYHLCTKKENMISQLKIPNHYKQHLGVINNLPCSWISHINKWPDSEFLNFYFWRKKKNHNAMTYIFKYGCYLGSLCEYTNVCTHNGQSVTTNKALSSVLFWLWGRIVILSSLSLLRALYVISIFFRLVKIWPWAASEKLPI